MYRVAEFRESCIACGQVVTARCARCGDPFCGWHLSTEDEVCEACEDGYQRALMSRHDEKAITKGVALMVVISLVIYGITGIGFLGMGMGIGVALLWASIRHYREVRRRQSYLAERRRPAPRLAPASSAAAVVEEADLTELPRRKLLRVVHREALAAVDIERTSYLAVPPAWGALPADQIQARVGRVLQVLYDERNRQSREAQSGDPDQLALIDHAEAFVDPSSLTDRALADAFHLVEVDGIGAPRRLSWDDRERFAALL